jgi:hypothetical protein
MSYALVVIRVKNKNLYMLHQPHHNQQIKVMRVPKGAFKWTGIL